MLTQYGAEVSREGMEMRVKRALNWVEEGVLLGARGGFDGWGIGGERFLVKTECKFGQDQIINRSRPKFDLVKTKFFSRGRIVPKFAAEATYFCRGGDQFEGVF